MAGPPSLRPARAAWLRTRAAGAPRPVLDAERFGSWRWRLAAAMMFAGAAAALAQVLAGGLRGDAPLLPLVPGLASGLCGVLVVRLRHRVPDGAYAAGALAGAVLLTLSTRALGVTGELAVDNVVFYLWPVLYMAAFLSWRTMLLQASVSSVLYGALLGEALPAPIAIARTGIAVVTLFGCGALVAVLRDRVLLLLAGSSTCSPSTTVS